MQLKKKKIFLLRGKSLNKEKVIGLSYGFFHSEYGLSRFTEPECEESDTSNIGPPFDAAHGYLKGPKERTTKI